ncbi:hypothetical protein GcC1_038030, partial [Golovinomyces cichoracearum]
IKEKKKSAGTIKGKDFTFNDSDSENKQTQRSEVNCASTKELAAFIKVQYDEWKREESFLDYDLWATLTEIFKSLRSILRKRGVWVDNEAKQDNTLFNCAQERILGQWSFNEIDLIKESSGTPTFSMLLQVKKFQSRAQEYNQIVSNEKKLPWSQSLS